MAINYQLLAFTSFIFLLSVGPKVAYTSDIGVFCGRHRSRLPSPAKVVTMYQSNQIGRMRLHEPDPDMFKALRGSGIQVTVGVKNEDIKKIATSYNAAIDWVSKNIRAYWPDVHFRYISVGNEAIPGNSAQFILPAMENLHNALSYGELWQRIKVTTIVSPSVMNITFPPSDANFSVKNTGYLIPIAQFLQGIGAPLLTNVYPYYDHAKSPKQTPLSYALFASGKDVFVDCGKGYRNSFDATIDAFYTSLEKISTPNVSIVVAETGWPSAGNNKAASIFYAWLYNSNLIKHVLSAQGTPKRPGVETETYLFSMFNEEKRLGGKTMTNFGLFYPDMKPVYPIDFNATTE
ncbi:hypothetical protein ACHQM5_013468 [Ranunculus cassubicifolius]